MFPWIQKNIFLTVLLSILIAAVVGEGAIIVRQAGQHGKTKGELVSVKRERDESRRKLSQWQSDYSALQKSHKQCITEIETSKQNQQAAIDNIAAFQQNLKDLSAQVRATRERIYMEPNCNALANLDIAAACPDLAASLRQRAAITRSRATE